MDEKKTIASVQDTGSQLRKSQKSSLLLLTVTTEVDAQFTRLLEFIVWNFISEKPRAHGNKQRLQSWVKITEFNVRLQSFLPVTAQFYFKNHLLHLWTQLNATFEMYPK